MNKGENDFHRSDFFLINLQNVLVIFWAKFFWVWKKNKIVCVNTSSNKNIQRTYMPFFSTFYCEYSNLSGFFPFSLSWMFSIYHIIVDVGNLWHHLLKLKKQKNELKEVCIHQNANNNVCSLVRIVLTMSHRLGESTSNEMRNIWYIFSFTPYFLTKQRRKLRTVRFS